MKRMKMSALTLLMGFCALWMSINIAQAQIDSGIRAADAWDGISWNPGNTLINRANLAIWNVNGNTFTAGFFYLGRGRVMGGRFSGDGSVDMVDMYSSPPVTLHGMFNPTPSGGFTMMLNVMQSGRSLGFIEFLRLFPKAGRDGSSPPDPAMSPGPNYTGAYQSGGHGHVGELDLTFNPTLIAGDQTNPPSDLTGRLLLGDISYQFVATINPERKADGNYAFDMIGHSPSLLIPCIRISGEFAQSASPTDPTHFFGMYELIALDMMTVDRGTFDIASP